MEKNKSTPYFALLAHVALVLLLSFLAFGLPILSPIVLGVGQQADRVVA